MTPLQKAEISKAILLGTHVYDVNHRAVGCVRDVEGSGSEAMVYIELGGLFCLEARVIRLPADALTITREDSGTLAVTSELTGQELNRLPAAR